MSKDNVQTLATPIKVIEMAIGRLDVKDGDLVLLQFAEVPPQDAVHIIGRQMQSALPKGARVLMLYPGITVSVMTKEEIDAQALSATEPVKLDGNRPGP